MYHVSSLYPENFKVILLHVLELRRRLLRHLQLEQGLHLLGRVYAVSMVKMDCTLYFGLLTLLKTLAYPPCDAQPRDSTGTTSAGP